MNEMITWLRAQLDTDEAHAHKDIWAAERATPGNWRAHYGVNLPRSHVKSDGAVVARFEGAHHEADALLAARFKPATVRARAERVLRQVQAHRAILDWLDELDRAVDGSDDLGWHRLSGAFDTDAVCRALASIYSDRDGYRAEWLHE